ncbi:helix-turn-helix domain-containing protein [Zhihengliuella sp.]|uniref:winged helix-turn-helix domain-containing protein n=1 Tax=Zhihengliuella sp. TaxID=1954483 RepID=UPI0028124C2A|nr:helix-turn-helix domain-containing protein [Zhihengliuella sp.]
MEAQRPAARRGEKATSDPRQIRALAHPTRLSLLDYLGTVEQATATECAAAVGESVASCSFHLRSLAQHGYIEPGERRGREKPWRKVFDSHSQRVDPEVPGSAAAVGAIAALTVDREAARLHGLVDLLPEMHPDDVDLNVLTTSSFYATDEELAELRDTLTDLAERFAGRFRDPGLRPEGARLAHLFGALSLDPAGLRHGADRAATPLAEAAPAEAAPAEDLAGAEDSADASGATR